MAGDISNFINIEVEEDVVVNGDIEADNVTVTTNIETDDITVNGTLTASTFSLGSVETSKCKFTSDGGFAVKLTNRTGGVTVKGEVVCNCSANDNSVIKIVKDVPNPIGVFLDAGVADGDEAWVVVAGIASVYFVGNTTRGHIARGFLTSDGASYVTGQALSEAVPSSPFASDKHFYEIGHVLENRTGAGLAKTLIHFN